MAIQAVSMPRKAVDVPHPALARRASLAMTSWHVGSWPTVRARHVLAERGVARPRGAGEALADGGNPDRMVGEPSLELGSEVP